MSAPTNDLQRRLEQLADATLEQAPVAAPDGDAVWRRGRRRTWIARSAAAGLVAAAVALATSLVLVMRPAEHALPSEGDGLSYPVFVSDLFPGRWEPGQRPVFGILTHKSGDDASQGGWIIERNGTLSHVPSEWPLTGAGALAPDGLQFVTSEGIVRLDRDANSIMRSSHSDPLIGGERRLGTLWRWSPDSQHVLIATDKGPAVVNELVDVSTPPLDASSDDDILPAGWLDATTIVGLRPHRSDPGLLDIMARSLDATTWSVLSTVDPRSGPASGSPTSAYVSPDGSRMLLISMHDSDDRSGLATLADTRSGQLVRIDEGVDTATSWDGCPPVWRGQQPLRAAQGLENPMDGSRTIMTLFDPTNVECVALAGNELTGERDVSPAGLQRERALDVILPGAGLLALVVAVWALAALRRSRRLEGGSKRWLPMIWVQRL